ncbi:MAG TPA: cytochrome b5-like heme/steroid binding domain-containing protein [Propionicimonas sp.]|jgi:cytochrome b involved in lipid metabolism|uniref:cytochrome b5-like heme/steroid binding domain-containing protein n=1 Tax=Propionicimonas sp. TaxID=1955623 RepID=UPI002F426D74
MSRLRSTLARAVVLPILLALSLTACSTGEVGTSPQSSTVVAGDQTGTQPVEVQTLAVKKYKMSTVRKHHTKSNCWSVIGKNVYKLTAFIKKHPGGAKRIIAICGKNGTKAFRGQHGTGGSANSILKKYKIGVLA